VAPLDQANLPSVPDTRSLSDVASPNEREIECYPKQCSEGGRTLLGGQQQSRGILKAPHQKQDDYDYQYDTDDSTGTVSPAASVRPSGQHADENQNQDNQQNGAKVHDSLRLFIPTASRAPPTRRSGQDMPWAEYATRISARKKKRRTLLLRTPDDLARSGCANARPATARHPPTGVSELDRRSSGHPLAILR
jgi:hypothetical protein